MPIKYVLNTFFRRLFQVEFHKTVDSKKAGHPVPFTTPVAVRLLYFYDILHQIRDIDGDVVECGVGWGRSFYMLCLCDRCFDKPRRYYGFDSFEGFPEPHPEDEPEHRAYARKGHYRTRQDAVLKFLRNSGIDQAFLDSKMSLIPGFFEHTLEHYNGKQVAFLHLDVDLYQSYKETLEFFYPKIAPGGIIAFDEYQDTAKYPGAQKAIDEFFSGKPEKLEHSPRIDRYYTVKVG